jgi:hypothetical protein
LMVEVMNNRYVHSGRGRFDPIFANLISVTVVYWLYRIAKIINQAHHSLEIPSFAT